jgi:hypothetical protein
VHESQESPSNYVHLRWIVKSSAGTRRFNEIEVNFENANANDGRFKKININTRIPLKE